LEAASSTAAPFFILAILVLIVRAPFWGKAVIDWDESTFILLGQSLLDGHLPYTHLWDIKPPLLFAVFSAFIGAFGRGIVAIRFGGALFVYATSIVVFFVTARLFDRAAGMISAISYVLAASLFYNGQVTYSEHIAVLPLVATVGMVAAYPYPPKSLVRSFGVGACCCAVCLIRANLIIPCIVITLIAAISTLRLGYRSAAYHVAAYVFGGVVLFTSVMVPYAASGTLGIFWDAVVVAPVAFQKSEGTLGWSVLGFVHNIGGTSGFMAVYCGLALVGFLCARGMQDPILGRACIMIGIITCSVGVSAVFSGWPQPHYILQMLPLLAIYVGIGSRELWYRSRPAMLAAAVVMGVSVGPGLHELSQEARSAGERVANGKGFVYGDSVEVAGYIRRLKLADYSIFAISDHIVYWILDKPLLTKLAHPSNIFRPALVGVAYGSGAGRASELEHILQKKPTVVIVDPWLLGWVGGKERIKSFLSSYVLAFCSGRLSVFIEGERGVEPSSACRGLPE
jgi:4-amino-4-deoxy-L-arabinose transferase-like glycosyltransferase